MSLFSYNSRHKVIAGIIVILASAAGFYLRDSEKPSYENGQSKQVGSQVDGRNHGMWVWYHPNGTKKMQGRFDHGKREGRWVTFDMNEDTLTVAQYHDDKLNGKFVEYKNGLAGQAVHYANDAVVK